jgi:hypothetical protein
MHKSIRQSFNKTHKKKGQSSMCVVQRALTDAKVNDMMIEKDVYVTRHDLCKLVED